MTDYTLKMPLPQNMQGAIDYRIQSSLRQNGWQLPCVVKKVLPDNLVVVEFKVYNAPMGTLPNVTVPIGMFNYVRMPIQVGDFGYTMTADVYLGGVTDKGGGRADFSNAGNLSSTLVFMPITNTKWDETDDPDKVVIWGPQGAIIRDEFDVSEIDVDQKEGVSIRGAESLLTISPAGISGITPALVGFTAGTSVEVTSASNMNLNAGTDLTATTAGVVLVTAGGAVTVTGGGVTTINGGNVVIAGATIEILGELIINGSPYRAHLHGGVTTGAEVSGPVVTP